jgi:large subunit ribosomal protein L28
MPARCELCGKGPISGNQVSHSHRKTRRRWLPNLQKITAYHKGSKITVRLCTRCLRTYQSKQKALA